MLRYSSSDLGVASEPAHFQPFSMQTPMQTPMQTLMRNITTTCSVDGPDGFQHTVARRCLLDDPE